MSRQIDLVVAVVFGAFGVGLVVVAQGLRQGSLADPLGVAGMPTAVGTFIALSCAVLALRQAIAWVRAEPAQRAVASVAEGTADEPGHPSSATRALGVAVILLGYVQLLPSVGYLLLTPIVLAIVLWSMQVRRAVLLSALCVGFTLATWLLFDVALGVRLPAGSLTPF